jgi:hypothetical protein
MFTDHPIQTKSDDRLRRESLAEKVAEMILKFEGTESFVIGIDGKWGSGKTSFINLVLESLDDKIIAVKFNPWQFNDSRSLLKDFLNSFSEKIEPLHKSAGKIFRRYGNKILSAVSFGNGLISINLGSGWFGDNETLEDSRESINKILGSLEKKVVIVVDDIDRLDPEETKLIFKLIKVSANFPNTIFLIAYDRARVAKNISAGEHFDGNEYLKKIIQVNFLIPEPETQDIWDIFILDLNKTLKDAYGTDDVDEQRWSDLFHGGLGGLLKTIRDVKSFINSLQLDFSIVSTGDVDAVDFIGIEAIRVFAPEFYMTINENKGLFTGNDFLLVVTGQSHEREDKEKRFNKLAEAIPLEIRGHITAIAKKLFPPLDFRMNYSSDWEVEWRSQKRISSMEKFDYYFRLAVPRGAVSETEIVQLIALMDDRKKLVYALKQFGEEKRLRKILSLLVDHAQEFDESQIENLTLALWQAQLEVADVRESVWDFDDLDTAIGRLIYHAVKAKILTERRKDFFLKIAKETLTLYPPLRLIAILDDESKKNEGTGKEYLLTADDLKPLKELGLKMIGDAAVSKALENDPQLLFLLYRWKQFGGEENMRQYVETLTSTMPGFLKFLSGCMGMIYSSTGNYNKIQKQAIAELYSLDKAKEKIDQLKDSDMTSASAKEKEAVELFKNSKRDQWSD